MSYPQNGTATFINACLDLWMNMHPQFQKKEELSLSNLLQQVPIYTH
jgi:hypothetical protein